MNEGLIIVAIMFAIGLILFISEDPGGCLQRLQGGRPRRQWRESMAEFQRRSDGWARQAGALTPQQSDARLDRFWAEDVKATDELIARIDAEVNRAAWDRLPPNVQQLVINKPKRWTQTDEGIVEVTSTSRRAPVIETTPIYHGPKPIPRRRARVMDKSYPDGNWDPGQ